jgi:hypothetical protein
MKKPTEDDHKNSVEHVAFEFYHFQLYGYLIQTQTDGRSPILPRGLAQAVGYEFLMHLRALVDFFYCNNGQDDDLLAADFCILPGFSRQFSLAPWNNPPEWSQQVKVHLNKRLAHITSPRWKERGPKMQYYHQHFPEIRDLISSFQAALPPELQDGLRAQMDQWARCDVALTGAPARTTNR